ncbi:MAG TPA: LytTR family DNA-binding domain-containing protein [Bacteroidales bacterium]|nr:LytTR family DNA-binding domain-containing protein [Bacteroidales bacterium]
MKNKLDRFILKLKPEHGISLKISFGIFLFIMFFQPFQMDVEDFNNQLLLISGYSVILYLIIVVVRVLSSLIFELNREIEGDSIFPEYFNALVIFLLSAVAFAFYGYFVAGTGFSFTVAIRTVILCLFPSVILSLNDNFRNLKKRNEELVTEKKNIQKQVEKFEEDILNKTLDFTSDTNNESLSLTVNEVVYIKSSDNYVEIVYRDFDTFKKKLLRNTLKNIELQIRQYSNFIRCHRTCIVNVHFIERLHRSTGNQWLTIKGNDIKLPVSRQYLLRVQEAL